MRDDTPPCGVEKVVTQCLLYIKHVFVMLISRKRVNHDRNTGLKTFTPYGKEVRVNKIALDSGLQMMQENEACNVLDDNEQRIILQNQGGNNFSLTHFRKGCPMVGENAVYQSTVTPFGIISQTKEPKNLGTAQKEKYDKKYIPFANVLWYIHKEMIPIYSECCLKSGAMQNSFGKLHYHSVDTGSISNFKKVPNSFMQDNAISIGMLLDILNKNWCKSNIKTSVPEGTAPETFFSLHYAARLLYLSSIFCATAPPEKNNSLYHVSQGRMSDMPNGIQASIFEGVTPEKNHLSLLLKGDDKEVRIMRCNLTVRKIEAHSDFVTKTLPSVMAMNSSTPSTDAVFVSGVYCGRGAIIYINSDTESEDSHKAAVNSFIGSHKL
jgi:hypothetical protein